MLDCKAGSDFGGCAGGDGSCGGGGNDGNGGNGGSDGNCEGIFHSYVDGVKLFEIRLVEVLLGDVLFNNGRESLAIL